MLMCGFKNYFLAIHAYDLYTNNNSIRTNEKVICNIPFQWVDVEPHPVVLMECLILVWNQPWELVMAAYPILPNGISLVGWQNYKQIIKTINSIAITECDSYPTMSLIETDLDRWKTEYFYGIKHRIKEIVSGEKKYIIVQK